MKTSWLCMTSSHADAERGHHPALPAADRGRHAPAAQQGHHPPRPEAPEHPAVQPRRAPRQPQQHPRQDRRLRFRSVPAEQHDGGHALRLPHVHGARGHHVPALRREGRPVEHRHHRVPVPDGEGALPGQQPPGPSPLLREEQDAGTHHPQGDVGPAETAATGSATAQPQGPHGLRRVLPSPFPRCQRHCEEVPTCACALVPELGVWQQLQQQLHLAPGLPTGPGAESQWPPSDPQSLGEVQQQLRKTLTSPADAAGFLQGSRGSGGSSKDSSCDTDDFVMVPAQFPGDLVAEAAGAKPPPDSLMCSGSSLVASAGLESRGRTPSPSPPCSSSPSPSGRAGSFSSRCGVSVPIPVPTQVHNYQRIEQNLQSPTQYQTTRSSAIRRSGSTSPLGFARASPSPPSHAEHGAALARKLSLGGGRPYTPSPQVGILPERPGWSGAPSPQGAEMRGGRSPRPGSSAPEHPPQAAGLGCRLHSAPNLSDLHVVRPKLPKPPTDPLGVAFGHAQSSPPQPAHGLQSCRPLRGSPKLPDFLQRNPLPPILGSPTKAMPAFDFPKTPSSQNLLTLLARQGVVMTPPRNRTLPDLSEAGPFHGQQLGPGLRPSEDKSPFGRSLSTGRLTDLLLKAAFGTQAPDSGSTDSLQEKPMEIAPSAGLGGNLLPGARAGGASSPSPVVFTVGSPPSGTTPPQGPRARMFSVGSSSSLGSAGSSSARHLAPGACSEAAPEAPAPGHCCTFADPVTVNLEGAVTFEAPDLPEETLMEQEHTEILHSLRFTLVFVQHVLEIAALRGSASDTAGGPEYQLQESVVADQISLLSREWGFAEQLVLYLKVAELLSSGLQTAIDQIRAGKLCLSSTVKQVVRKLNELYKASVVSCQGLSLRLQRFFLDKQRLLDRIQSVTAEKLIFSHAVQTVQSAALDEMFHRREDCVQRYHKALLLMEGLQHILTDQADVENIAKCKLCIERRLSALLTGICA
ncbi:serine/threonine-protein kinase ULK1 isoform X5 [Ursus americanus]|uniref:serine/threonine-protein kinase ULK1 isoform X5 n=1 Tax=Ursus americanus TaxID=9643 RepID=UPI001E67D5ED|nr:serine/threonine-protein kinase ULK1 isoform X5 [Ursus americanus]